MTKNFFGFFTIPRMSKIALHIDHLIGDPLLCLQNGLVDLAHLVFQRNDLFHQKLQLANLLLGEVVLLRLGHAQHGERCSGEYLCRSQGSRVDAAHHGKLHQMTDQLDGVLDGFVGHLVLDVGQTNDFTFHLKC